jgi:hypothetical protein
VTERGDEVKFWRYDGAVGRSKGYMDRSECLELAEAWRTLAESLAAPAKPGGG